MALLLVIAVIFSFKTYQLERQKIEVKNDLIELSKIKYGLFNVDEWKNILVQVISSKVEEFNLDDVNKAAMRRKISGFLTTTINEMETRYYEQKSKSLVGILQGGVASITGTFEQLKKDIPIFTEQILDFLDEKENREAIRQYLIDQLNEYADETFSETDYSTVDVIVKKYGAGDRDETSRLLGKRLTEIDTANELNKSIISSIAMLLMLLLLTVKSTSNTALFLSLSTSLLYLLLGILLPMIEIDARISSMSFTILGQPVAFTDQVLYYKSKSILEVVELMMLQGDLKLIAVGTLVLAFSVLFPVTKLICSASYIQSPAMRSNRLITAIVMKSGKWSMADVMVIVIFMAYLGFDGIISEQLQTMESLSTTVDLLTTNQSNLLFGFFMFTAFVLMALLTSRRIEAFLVKIKADNTTSRISL